MSEDLTRAKSRADWMSYAEGLELTVMHDDGLYRHLRFRGPGYFWFELVTWPGYLHVGGDLEGYTFTRDRDMFEFFGSGVSGVEPGRINPQYWQEKITASGQPPREWSPEKYRAAVVATFMDARHRFPKAMPLWEQVREELLNDETAEHAEYAHTAIDQFHYSDGNRHFQFEDSWEWDLKDWDTHYLRACWAIVWGIGQYRAQAAAAIGGAR